MSRDLRRRIIRLEQSDNQGAVRFDVSDCPFRRMYQPRTICTGALPFPLSLTEDEWMALYSGDDA